MNPSVFSFFQSQTLLRSNFPVLDSLAGKGDKKVMLMVKKGKETLISQEIPTVHRSNCTIPKVSLLFNIFLFTSF